MRTLLNIDDDILAAAERIAAERQMTTDSVISEILRKALPHSSTHPYRMKNGFPLLPAADGTVVTPEMVRDLLEWQDVESAA